MRALFPARSTSSKQTVERLERHYRDVQDIEFTVEQGRLYLLQTRSAKRTAAAAVKSAVAMVEEGLLSRDDAIARIDPAQLDHLLHPMLDPTRDLRRRRDRSRRFSRRGLGPGGVRCRHAPSVGARR